MPDPVAVLLARYRELSTLGAGGMATVVLAEDTLLGRPVALKRVTGPTDIRALSRLRREALVGASVSHPNLVSIYDVLTEEDAVVIVMEYVNGETLRAALEREGALAPARALQIVEGVAAGLDALHVRGIVHRDVKPANVLLGYGGAVKLADFGIAAVPEQTRITAVGTVVGSFSYMAPEQLEDAPPTPAMDIYALGVIAYEALSGARAHPETNPLAIAHAIATRPPPDLRDAWPQAPVGAAELLGEAMARDPARRPYSATGFAARLRGALGLAAPMPPSRTTRPAPPRARPPAPPRARPPVPPRGRPGPTAQDRDTAARRRRAAWPFAALALLMAVAVVLTAVLASGGSSPSARRTAATRRAPASRIPAAASAGARTQPAVPVRHGLAVHHQPPSHPALRPHTTTAPTPKPPPAASGPAAGAVPPIHGAGPADTARAFYELAADHRYGQAWSLADPVFQSEVGGYSSFVSEQAGEEAIVFREARLVSRSNDLAVVFVRTTSVRDDGTHQCAGTVTLASDGSGGAWLLHYIDINCSG